MDAAYNIDEEDNISGYFRLNFCYINLLCNSHVLVLLEDIYYIKKMLIIPFTILKVCFNRYVTRFVTRSYNITKIRSLINLISHLKSI
jgi:hypothetical protein